MERSLLDVLFKYRGGASGRKRNGAKPLTSGGGRKYKIPDISSMDKSRGQRSIVKVAIGRSMGSLSKHVHYITRASATMEGEPATLFTKEASLTPNTAYSRQSAERRFFKFIISPEHGEDLDLVEHARLVMASAEECLGRRLDWFAAVHTNTGSHHIHVVVRGLDLDGKDLKIPSQFLTSEIRNLSSVYATMKLGHRSDREIAESLDRDVVAERLTTIDKVLDRQKELGFVQANNVRQERRLKWLEKEGLAEAVGGGRFALQEGWTEILLRRGNEIAFLETLHEQFGYDKIGALLTERTTITGVVVSKELDEQREELDAVYVIVAADDGKYYRYAGQSADEYNIKDKIAINQGKASKEFSLTDRHVLYVRVTNRDSISGVVSALQMATRDRAGEVIQKGFIEVRGDDYNIYRYYGKGYWDQRLGSRIEIQQGKILGRELDQGLGY